MHYFLITIERVAIAETESPGKLTVLMRREGPDATKEDVIKDTVLAQMRAQGIEGVLGDITVREITRSTYETQLILKSNSVHNLKKGKPRA